MYKIKQGDQTRESSLYLKNRTVSGADVQVPLFIAPANCVIKKISWSVDTQIPRSDTNYEEIIFYNKGSDGTGTDVIISGSTANALSGQQPLNAYDEIDMAIIDTGATLSPTNKYLATGDVVSIATISGGVGILTGHANVKLVYELTDLKNREEY